MTARHVIVLIVCSLAAPATAGAAEIRGDLIDNDSPANGLIDEGCWPARVTGVCESPISCGRTGAVAPKSGQLVYPEAPDLEPSVPFGPPLQLERVYMSLAADQSGYQGSVGKGWRHSFQGWLDWQTNPNPDQVFVRLTTGQEVFFTAGTPDGTYDYFNPQPGFHIKVLRRHKTTGVWELITLDGWTYEYDSSSCSGLRMLKAIKDPFGKALTLTYNGSCYLTEVTDASGYRDLRFAYDTNNKLDKVDFYLDDSLRLTVQYTVTSDKLEDVTVGSTLVRDYVWTGNKLDYVDDGDAKTLADFDYLSGAAGKVARISTGDGNLGYEYGNTDCDGGEGVYVYYNDTDATDAGCDAHSECENGDGFCGGETDASASNTGVCYRAQRCVSLSSIHDDLVEAVSSSCTTCTDTKTYSWDSSSPERFLVATQRADDLYNSYLRNSHGLVTKLVEGDDDTIASNTNPSAARVTWFFYDSDIPGLVTEVRRKSELNVISTCSDSVTTDCKRTIYSYQSAGGNGKKLVSVREIGLTYVWVSNDVGLGGYDFTTTYTHDSNGRLTQINGPRPDADTTHDIIEFTYWSSSDRLKDGMLNEVKRKLGTSTYLTSTHDSYDYWGNAGSIQDPNGNFTCRTFHADLDVLTVNRVAMNNQTSCATSHSSDLVTTTTYDPAKRVKKIERPLGNCVHRAYDSKGRLSIVRERDDCTVASAGHNMELTYNDDGLTIKTEHKDSSGTVTYRNERTYGADRRLFELVNPTQTTKKTTLAYEVDGMLDSVTRADGIGVTQWNYDARNRADFEQRFFASSSSDDYDILNCKQMDRIFDVGEEDGRSMERTWDDMRRNVQQITPDGGTSRYVYDEAGNLKHHVEADGSSDELHHAYSYDSQNRILSEDYGDANCGTYGGPEVQYLYDSTSSCPSGATCSNLSGRLARVRTKVSCYDDGVGGDDTFEQFTYFGYDDAGRTLQEAITDDGGRSVRQNYTWDENGNQTMVEAPSGIDMKWTYGSGGSNSDGDKIVSLIRNDGADTTFISNGVWYPFGPIKEYQQGNTVGTSNVVAAFTWDLAHRPTELRWKYSTTDVFKIGYTLDAQGRITARDFTGDSAVQDAWYLYDWQDRILCDATVAPTGGTCPTGNDRKNELTGSPPYSSSSDRRVLFHRAQSAYPADTFTYAYATGGDQIQDIDKSSDTNTSNRIRFGWDGRGNRLYDDDDQWTADRRDYTYDGRNNLVTVSGKMRISDTVVHDYTQVNAYDHKNRRFFKSLLDEATSVEAHWFFYYDLQDRLIEVNYTPDIGSPTIFQVIQFYWIGSRPVARVMTTYPGGTHGRRFLHADHLDTPLDAWYWPSSGDTTRAWAYNPDAFGWGAAVHGATDYQPLRFPGQVTDEETTAWFLNTGTSIYDPVRPPLSDNRYRVYDPLTGSYLQVDPGVANGWQAYAYADNNAVHNIDPRGLEWYKPWTWNWFCISCWATVASLSVAVTGACDGVEADESAVGCGAALASVAGAIAACAEAGCGPEGEGEPCFDVPATPEDDCFDPDDPSNYLNQGGGWTVDGYWSPHDRPGSSCYRAIDGDSVCSGPDFPGAEEIPPEWMLPDSAPKTLPGDPRPPLELVQ